MTTVKVPIVGTIEGDDGQDARIVYLSSVGIIGGNDQAPAVKFSKSKPKRKSSKDLQIERLTKDLEEAKRGLRRICEAARAGDTDHAYRVGMCHSVASWSLKVLGDSTEDDRFMAEVHEALARYKQNGVGQ